MKREELGRAIYDIANIRGEFLLRSGVVSSEYFDKYRFEAQPILLREIAAAMLPLLPDGVDLLAGLEMGGIPIATMLSQVCGMPTAFVRKEAKQYGIGRLAEGAEVAGRKVVVIEDVVTSGGQILSSVAALRSQGALIETVLCVIDREAGGKENLEAAGLELRPLFTKTELEGSGAGGH